MEKKQKNSPLNDLEDRILCEDESCIGTIGEDGRCRECGLPSSRQPNDGQMVTPSTSVDEDDSSDHLADDFEEDFCNDQSIVEDDDDLPTGTWEERTLCPDESCTGTIGSDGHCRVCGLANDPLQQ